MREHKKKKKKGKQKMVKKNKKTRTFIELISEKYLNCFSTKLASRYQLADRKHENYFMRPYHGAEKYARLGLESGHYLCQVVPGANNGHSLNLTLHIFQHHDKAA